MVGAMSNPPPIPTSSYRYYPPGVEIVGYVTNDHSVSFLLSVFAGGCAAILALAYAIVRSRNPTLPMREVTTVMWFVICGCLHVFFEGYYIDNFRRMGVKMDVFGQLWKEYALSDSRYLTQNPFVFSVELVTVLVWGPLSWLTAAMITDEHPLRHPLQLAVSIGHLYSDVLYYVTSAADQYLMGIEHSRPEPLYFWLYYVGLNFVWIVVPICLIYSSATAIARAFEALSAHENALRSFRAASQVEKKKS